MGIEDWARTLFAARSQRRLLGVVVRLTMHPSVARTPSCEGWRAEAVGRMVVWENQRVTFLSAGVICSCASSLPLCELRCTPLWYLPVMICSTPAHRYLRKQRVSPSGLAMAGPQGRMQAPPSMSSQHPVALQHVSSYGLAMAVADQPWPGLKAARRPRRRCPAPCPSCSRSPARTCRPPISRPM